MNNASKLYQRYQESSEFTDADAWALFRLAARGEAIGWTLLAIGILCTKLPVSWNRFPVQLAGSMHGSLFIAYIMAVLVLSPSLGWRGPQTLIAGLCSVPPYGSLVYERWVAYRRNRQHMEWLGNSVRYQAILDSLQ